MCSKCDEFNESITRYRRLSRQITDKQTVETADRLIAELEAKILAQHSKK